MKRHWVWMALVLLTPALQHCGDCDDGGAAAAPLSIEPAGPTIVRKGDTLQLSAGSMPVTWSVEGGDGNGRVDANGRFTHPDTLPPDPRVTVRAQTADGRTATAQIDLHTAETISFSAPQVLNAAPILDVILEASVSIAGVGDGLAVGIADGTVHVDGIWSGFNADTANLYFAQEIDLDGFGPQRNLEPTTDPQVEVFGLGIAVDSMLNPGILLSGTENGLARVLFIGSDDQGATFGAPVPLDDFLGAAAQFQAALVFDRSDTAHAVFVTNSGEPTPQGQVVYTRSSDGGLSWRPTVTIPASGPQCFPQLAVTDDGDTVLVCYESPCGAGAVSVARSTDGGATFDSPVAISSGASAAFCQLQAGTNDTVLVSYQQGGAVILMASGDGGQTFPARTVVNSTPTHLPAASGPGPLPHLAVDRLGQIDVVWSADSNGNGTADALRYARSTDGGQTFTPDQTVATTGGALLFALAARDDQAGRCHVQFASDSGLGGTYNVLYMRAE